VEVLKPCRTFRRLIGSGGDKAVSVDVVWLRMELTAINDIEIRKVYDPQTGSSSRTEF
jgi:hypothetical protein